MAPVLGYWNVRGLTSSIRNLLRFAEAEFEEKLYEFSEDERKVWQADKSTLDLDFPNLPYYIDGEVKLTQVIPERENLSASWKSSVYPIPFRVQQFYVIWAENSI